MQADDPQVHSSVVPPLRESHPPSSRFQFVDLLRGWAVIVMIEVHVVNACIRIDLRDSTMFSVLNFINGLVAPSFLFCAGFALAVSLHRKWNAFMSGESVRRKYVLRLLGILVLGYTLHITYFSLATMMARSAEERTWLVLFQVDILHTIAVTLLLLVGLALIMREEPRFILVTGILAALIIFLAPIVRELDYSNWPWWLRSYFTHKYKSQFPLFPWSGFLMTGAVMGFLFLKAQEKGEDGLFMKRSTFFAIGAILIAIVAELLPGEIYPNQNFWASSPQFVILRIAIVVLLLALMWKYERKKPISPRSVVTLFGRESLIVYAVHLTIVYGHTFDWSFIRLYPKQLGYPGSFALTLVLVGGMYLLAWLWEWLKKKNIWFTRIVIMLTLVISTAMFLMM